MWTLDFRAQSVGGPVARPRLLDDRDAWIGGGDLSALPPSTTPITFVVHGFNNDRGDGLAGVRGLADAAIAQVPGLRSDRMVGVLWPGDAIVGFLSYPTEERDADTTAERFARVLRRSRLSPPPNFVTHSLGARVVLRALQILVDSDPDRAWAGQIVLMAAALDDDALARDDRYRAAVDCAARVVNVASTADDVLRFTFPAGDWVAGLCGGGYTRAALGYAGPAPTPRPPDRVWQFQVGSLGVGHHDYLGGGADPKRRRAAAFAGHVVTRFEPLGY